MRYGSVCSGIEAATAAWHHMGWEPAFFSEIEPFPRAVLEHHYSDVPLHGDFTTIEENQYGKIDLLVGGTPCQSFSIAGLRGGLDDERGNLALEFCRLAQREQPRWIVWENVPGVLSSNGGRDFGSILGALEELGYGLAYRVLDAQYFGVAQRRRRVFVVGYLGDWRRAAAVLFERHSMCGHPAPSREARKEAARNVALSTHECGERRRERPYLSGPLTAGMHKGPRGTESVESNHVVSVPQPYSIMPMNSGKDYKARETEVAQPIMAGGPVGGNQGGDYVVQAYDILGVPATQGAKQTDVHVPLRARAPGQSEASTTTVILQQNDAHEVVPFDTTQITSPHNYSNPKAGDPCHPLAAGAHPPAIAIQDVRGVDKAQNGKGWSDENVSYTVDTHATQGVAHAVAFAQNTRDEVRIIGGDGEIAGALAASPGMKQTTYIAFSAKDHSGDATEEMSPTLRAGGHSGSHANAGVMPAVAYPISSDADRADSSALTPSPDAEGRVRLRDPGLGVGDAGDPMYTLQATKPHAVAMGFDAYNNDVTGEVAKTLDVGQDYHHVPNVMQSAAVRRLTPVECERLQGFPDNFTAIPWKKKPADQCPDGPRYKALGNSMAVPVMRWIGERIQLVDDLTSLL